MSNPTRLPPARQRFVLRVRPPVRAYLLAALGSLLGAVLLVWWRAAQLPIGVGVVGIVLLALGVLLAAAALLLTLRARTTLLLDAETLTVVTGARRRVLSWSEIDDVTLDGARLVFGHRDRARVAAVLVDPRQREGAAFTEMVRALRSRLDVSRGYRD